jgi:hypothetical protein
MHSNDAANAIPSAWRRIYCRLSARDALACVKTVPCDGVRERSAGGTAAFGWPTTNAMCICIVGKASYLSKHSWPTIFGLCRS